MIVPCSAKVEAFTTTVNESIPFTRTKKVTTYRNCGCKGVVAYKIVRTGNTSVDGYMVVAFCKNHIPASESDVPELIGRPWYTKCEISKVGLEAKSELKNDQAISNLMRVIEKSKQKFSKEEWHRFLDEAFDQNAVRKVVGG